MLDFAHDLKRSFVGSASVFRFWRKILIVFALLTAFTLHSDEYFQTIVLGCGGGPLENNLSGYLLAPKGSKNFIALDAGTLLSGIFLAQERNSFQNLPADLSSKFNLEASILRDHVKAYVISHPHLDHVAALIINSTVDTPKPIFGTPFTIDNIRDHLFNWKIWPNFGSEGNKPILNKYQYQRLKMQQRTPIPNTEMTIESFPLSHSNGYLSTAFLVESKDHYTVYFGDTSPDALEPKKHIQLVWERIAPLIREKKLNTIFLECSYTDHRKTNELYGHLDPKYMIEELHQLANLVNAENPKTALAGFTIVVTHIKEALLKDVVSREVIEFELNKLNDLGVEFIFPKQGEKIEF